MWRNWQYARDLKSRGRNTVWVQVPPSPPAICGGDATGRRGTLKKCIFWVQIPSSAP